MCGLTFVGACSIYRSLACTLTSVCECSIISSCLLWLLLLSGSLFCVFMCFSLFIIFVLLHFLYIYPTLTYLICMCVLTCTQMPHKTVRSVLGWSLLRKSSTLLPVLLKRRRDKERQRERKRASATRE